MTIQTIRRITFIVLDVLVVLVPRVPLSLCSPLTVSLSSLSTSDTVANHNLDQKQARDLVNVLKEANQQIDPRLVEMTRYGGGGGGGGRYGRGGGRGGWGGGRGGGTNYSATNGFWAY